MFWSDISAWLVCRDDETAKSKQLWTQWGDCLSSLISCHPFPFQFSFSSVPNHFFHFLFFLSCSSFLFFFHPFPLQYLLHSSFLVIPFIIFSLHSFPILYSSFYPFFSYSPLTFHFPFFSHHSFSLPTLFHVGTLSQSPKATCTLLEVPTPGQWSWELCVGW